MVLIPESRLPYALPVAAPAEPCLGSRVDGGCPVVAEQGYRMSFDVAAQASRPGLVFDRQPEKRHLSDNAADLALQSEFAFSYIAFRSVAVSPRGKCIPVTCDQGSADDQPENGAPVIAAARTRLAFVLGKPRPELCAGAVLEGRWCMNPRACGLQRPALS